MAGTLGGHGGGRGCNSIISGINVTPLVDIMLVLLIIFMVTTTVIVKDSIPIKLPEASTGEAKKVSILAVTVNAKGELFLNGESADKPKIRAFIKQETARGTKLEAIIAGRADVETRSKFKRKLLAGTPQSAYDFLKKPHAVAFDPQGRILVTDSQAAALIRFDREGRIMDVFGTKGPVTLELPLGLDVGVGGLHEGTRLGAQARGSLFRRVGRGPAEPAHTADEREGADQGERAGQGEQALHGVPRAWRASRPRGR